ncbi:precorrin-2 C(20)-methyltransferase [Pseudodesulfovibrio senegalensis]|uniref:Precorrin-2 C(20)-methyltransferase n=1 Tax=Pseudodesulfovibrio senegalensis TaxID=1721087 RepID=A0A6N6N3Y7_9BACT|nr:precorrin-2 C(20)-methyltransferase [Pseudodesulfovibrio senegalensis]KAB1442287.1 precorrin-2 C(20)-methyltransferase [Pseudodesulfovibrio senegalensis]
MTKPGMLHGIGVGPGDPELLTFKAVRMIHNANVVFAAASTKNDYSTALNIARPHMREDVRVVQLGFPMTRDKAVLQSAWEANARIVARELHAGNDGVFLTLGDPLTYSTFGYLQNMLKRLEPDLRIGVVPGITSYQAAAARVGFVLAESEESLVLTSGVCKKERLKELLDKADNAVILKAYKNFAEIRDTLNELRLNDRTVLVSRLGMDNESILMDIKDAPERPHYFSLALVRKNTHE